jgi:hypothetical protein
MQYFIYKINRLSHLIIETIKRPLKNLIPSSKFSKIRLLFHSNPNQRQEILYFCG